MDKGLKSIYVGGGEEKDYNNILLSIYLILIMVMFTGCLYELFPNRFIVFSNATASQLTSREHCMKKSYGYKKLPTIDSFIFNHAWKNSRNVSVAYIDYRKASDSVPYSRVLENLNIYKTDNWIIVIAI